MVYICRVHADGNPEDRVVFVRYEDALVWAKKHARIVPPLGHGWDVTYTVRVYSCGSAKDDISNMEPISVVSPA